MSFVQQPYLSTPMPIERRKTPYLKLALSEDPSGQLKITYLKPEPEEERKSGGLLGKKRGRPEEESRTIALARCDKSIQDSIIDQDDVQMEGTTQDRLY